jgi:hypothetical protein
MRDVPPIGSQGEEPKHVILFQDSATIGLAAVLIISVFALTKTGWQIWINDEFELRLYNAMLFRFSWELNNGIRILLLSLFPALIWLGLLTLLSRISVGLLSRNKTKVDDRLFHKIFSVFLSASIVLVVLMAVLFSSKFHNIDSALGKGRITYDVVLFTLLLWILSLVGPARLRSTLQRLLPLRKAVTISVFWIICIYTLGLVVGPMHAQRSTRGRPNVIMLVVDTLRADHVGSYSNCQLTPNIDQFSEESVVFLNASAQAPNTINSAPSIFSSVYPSEHGYFSIEAKVSPKLLMLAEVLRDVGYRTFGISTNPYVASWAGLDQGFETFIEQTDFRPTDAAKVNYQALRWMERNPERPFFVLLWYMEPHEPYNPPSSFVNKFVEDELKPLISNRTKLFDRDAELNKEERAVSKKLYAAEVNYFDSEFGLFMKELKRLNLIDNSLIILTSDHGEAFWEHLDVKGEPIQGHGNSLHGEQIDIPLIIRFPEAEHTGVIKGRVGSIDILPTVLEVVQVDDMDRLKHCHRGISLLGHDPRDYSISERIGKHIMRCIQNNDMKLMITYKYGDEFFDEPVEQLLDLHRGEQGIVTETGDDLLEKQDLIEALYRWESILQPFETSNPELGKNKELQLREKLEALGYVN